MKEPAENLKNDAALSNMNVTSKTNLNNPSTYNEHRIANVAVMVDGTWQNRGQHQKSQSIQEKY